jgi:hypothetical protein
MTRGKIDRSKRKGDGIVFNRDDGGNLIFQCRDCDGMVVMAAVSQAR